MTFFEGNLVFDKITLLLLRKYPNPFNSLTTIHFSLQKERKVKLSVIDIQGKQIAVLIQKNMQAGKYPIEFNGNNIPKDEYLYRIETKSYQKNKKMIKLK